jgi:hypothetical protein
VSCPPCPTVHIPTCPITQCHQSIPGAVSCPPCPTVHIPTCPITQCHPSLPPAVSCPPCPTVQMQTCPIGHCPSVVGAISCPPCPTVQPQTCPVGQCGPSLPLCAAAAAGAPGGIHPTPTATFFVTCHQPCTHVAHCPPTPATVCTLPHICPSAPAICPTITVPAHVCTETIAPTPATRCFICPPITQAAC